MTPTSALAGVVSASALSELERKKREEVPQVTQKRKSAIADTEVTLSKIDEAAMIRAATKRSDPSYVGAADIWGTGKDVEKKKLEALKIEEETSAVRDQQSHVDSLKTQLSVLSKPKTGQGTTMFDVPQQKDVENRKTQVSSQLVAAEQKLRQLSGEKSPQEAIQAERSQQYQKASETMPPPGSTLPLATTLSGFMNTVAFGIPRKIAQNASGLSADSYDIMQAARQSKMSLREKAENIVGGLVGFGTDIALLSGLPLIAPASRTAQVGTATVRQVAPWYTRAVRGAQLFGGRAAIEETVKGDVSPENIGKEAMVGAAWEIILPMVGGVVRRATRDVVGNTRFVFDPKSINPQISGEVESATVQFFRKMTGGVTRSLEVYLKDGSYNEIRVSPNGGRFMVEVTNYSPSWFKKIGENIMGVFKSTDKPINVKGVSIVDSPNEPPRRAPANVKRTVMGYIEPPAVTPEGAVKPTMPQSPLGKFITAPEAEGMVRQYFSPAELGVEVVQRIISPEGERALGKYREGMISFIQNPNETTPDHEAVHAYLDLFTPAEQKRAILEEVMQQNGTEDEVHAEEILADGFVQYVKNGKVRGFARQVIEWFRDIYAKIKGLFSDPDKSRQLYRDIILKRRSLATEPGTTVSPDVYGLQTEMYQNPERLTTKLLKGLAKDTVGQQEIRDLLRKPEIKQAEREVITKVLNDNFYDAKEISVQELREAVADELVPLKVTDRTANDSQNLSLYEGIVLPPDLQGNVETYGERVYQSPVPTNAGDVHFSRGNTPGMQSFPNYFAHTRVETIPMTDVNGEQGIAWRVLEVQSDLFQKGRLENEGFEDPSRRAFPEEIVNRRNELNKLEPYRNTWWQRVVREEIRSAALDGKKAIMFPTGETAMKVEGLGGTDLWYTREEAHRANAVPLQTMEELSVGQHLYRTTETNRDGAWVVTEVLDRGRFKAVPEIVWDARSKDAFSITEDMTTGGQKVAVVLNKETGRTDQFPSVKRAQAFIDARTSDAVAAMSDSETFDISGEIDQTNPIYQFYDHTVAGYLQRLRKGNIEQITDQQGVTWWMSRIQPEDGGAVEAYQRDVLQGDIFGQEKEIKRQKQEAQISEGAKKTVEAFEKSGNQEVIGKKGNIQFEIGDFARRGAERKAKKGDRLSVSDLRETIKNITEAYRASGDKGSYRYDNIAWIAKMPDGEMRAIYTRQNANGAEEVLSWHTIKSVDAEKYIATLRLNGIPGGNRTLIPALEPQKSSPLTYGDGTHSTEVKMESQELFQRFPDTPEFREKNERYKELMKELEENVVSAEKTVEKQKTYFGEESEDTQRLEGLAEQVRELIPPQQRRLPGGITRNEFFDQLATSVDSVSALHDYLIGVADKTKNATFGRNIREWIYTYLGGGNLDGVEDWSPFQRAITEKKAAPEAKPDLIDRAENIIAELGDFEISEGKTLGDLLDDITVLELQLDEATRPTRGEIEKRLKERASEGAVPISSDIAEVQSPVGRGTGETYVTGRALIDAIRQVSKAKTKEFSARLVEAVGEARRAQKAKDMGMFAAKKAQIEAIKSEMVEEIRKRVPMESRGKFLSAVKNVSTRGQLEKALQRADLEAERIRRRDIIFRIKNLATNISDDVDVEYQTQISELVKDIDFSKPTEATRKKLLSRLDYIERTGGAKIPPELKEEVSRLTKTPLADMPTDDLEKLHDAILTLQHLGKVRREMEVALMERAKEKKLELLSETMVNIDPLVDEEGYLRAAKEVKKAREKSRNIFWRAQPFFANADTMDGYRNMTGRVVAMAKELNDAENRGVDSINDAQGRAMRRIINEVDLTQLDKESQAKIMAAHVYDLGLTDRMKASGWGEDRPQLNGAEENLLTIIREEGGEGRDSDGEQVFPKLAAINATYHNEYTPKVKGYGVKLEYADTAAQDPEVLFETRYAAAKMDAASSLKSTEGVLQARKQHVERVLRTDILNLLMETIAQQRWLVHVEPTIRNIYSVVNHAKFKEMGGRVASDSWNDKIKDVALAWRNHAVKFDPESFIDWNRNLGVAYMGFKAATALIQTTQLPIGAAYVLGHYGAAAAAKFFWIGATKLVQPSLVRTASEATPFIRQRRGGDPLTAAIMQQVGVPAQGKDSKDFEKLHDSITELVDERNAAVRWFIDARQAVGEKSMDWIKFMDVRTAAATYEAFKSILKDTGASDAEAESQAEVLGMYINNSASATYRPLAYGDISGIRMRPAKFLAKQYLLFKAFNINTLAMAAHSLVQGKVIKGRPTFTQKGQGRGGMYARYMGLLALALLAATNATAEKMKKAINGFIRGKKVTDDPNLLMAFILAQTQMIPGVGEFAQTVRNAQLGRPWAQNISAPVFDALIREAEAIGSLLKNPAAKTFLNASEGIFSMVGLGGTGQIFDVLERFTPSKKTKKKSAL